jgi:hypothetical protein
LEQKPREGDFTPESMEGFLAGTISSSGRSFLDKIASLFTLRPHHRHPISLEIAAYDQITHFYIIVHQDMQAYVESQLAAAYPKALVTLSRDYLPTWTASATKTGQLTLTAAPYLPLKTWRAFEETDPLAQILGVMSKLDAHDKALVQIIVGAGGSSWTNAGWHLIQAGITTGSDNLKTKAHPQERTIKDKLSQTGLRTAIRILAASNTPERAESIVNQLGGSFSVFTSQDGNSLRFKHPWAWQCSSCIAAIARRSTKTSPKQILTVPEVASMFHLPGYILAKIPNLSWSKEVMVEAPQNLPIALNKTDEEKQEINFFARTQYKNAISTFGIKRIDRRRHMYIIGKSGTGKTTLIANMAIADMRNGEGVGLIDPHGDLCDKILDYIPSHRLNDVVYLDPSDSEHPFFINVLELKSTDMMHRNLVVSGIVAIFSKLYAYSWGPRLEYILRNAIATLVDTPGATLVNLPDLLANDKYRAGVVEKLTDNVLKNFWLFEYNKADPRTRSEWISPILNKVGQFVGSPIIRQIIGNPRSTVDLERIMNEGKIIILNLSQGKIGEDNATLLGAMLITKMQLYAMNRAHIPEDQRRDFFLYVDEFQNFATDSFAKILSEARKYRLDLIVANQYIGQVPEELQKAIFGNVGTLLAFVVGAQDARWLFKEFGEVYKESELVSLGNYQIVIKMTMDGLTSSPFTAITLPLPKSKNQNREKVIRLSREKFTKARPSQPGRLTGSDPVTA